mgnify:CR=1 FL=1
MEPGQVKISKKSVANIILTDVHTTIFAFIHAYYCSGNEVVAKEKADHNCRLTSKFVVTGTRG